VPRIEFLYWEGCPSHPEALELVQQVLAERGLDAELELREVHTHEEAEELRFPGSPTIRVDGRDVDPAGAQAAPSLSCRLYRLADGRPSPVPTRAHLEDALQMTLTLASHAPSFSLPGVDGRDHSLDDYGESELLVLVQSCNHCPYVQAWEGRMVAIQRDYADRGVRLVAVNSNDADRYPGDSFEAMQSRARSEAFNFDYLHDEDQSLARALRSERTPEVFVFDRGRRLVYHGAIDDNRDDTAVTRHYLRDALDALLAGGRPAVAETPAVGCTVKWRE
jgi:hypothetical protein